MSVACMALNAESQTKPEPKGIEFRIDTDVYVDESKPPVASTKTLFLRDRVIECDDAKQRAMILEYSTQQIVLVDLAAHRSCRMEMAALESKLSSLKTQMTPEQMNIMIRNLRIMQTFSCFTGALSSHQQIWFADASEVNRHI